jgi:hypothetical protein
MIYAFFGIPLFLMTMVKVGKLMTTGLKYLWSFVHKFYYIKQLRWLRKTKTVQRVEDGLTKIANLGPASEASDKSSRSSQDRESLDEKTQIVEDETQEAGVDNVDNASYKSLVIDDTFNLPPLVAILITIIYIVAGSAMYSTWEGDWTYHEAFYFIFISISTIGFGDVTPQHTKFFLLSSIYILFGLALVAMVINTLIEFFRETIQTVREHIHVPNIFKHHDSEEDLTPRDLKSGIAKLAENFQTPLLNNNSERRMSV